MSTLYYTNATSDFSWTTLENWNTLADGTGDIATSIPWSEGYFDYDLVDAAAEGLNEWGARIINVPSISSQVTGSCDLSNFVFSAVAISGGTFSGSWISIGGGTIANSIFSGNNITIAEGAEIFSGAKFSGNGVLIYGSTIYNGEFIGASITFGYPMYIQNGTFEISGLALEFPEVMPANITTLYYGQPYTGSFNGYDYVNGNYSQSFTGYYNGSYYVLGVITTLPESGTGLWQNNYYISGVITTLNSSGKGWWNGNYYIDGVVTTLNSNGTGSWNGSYYIMSVITTLNTSGNGVWNNIYYLSGTSTTLNSSGTGTWNNSYYIGGVLTTLNAIGTGSWENVYYISGVSTSLNNTGSGSWNGSYYINATLTTLDEGGNGSWNGSTYIGGINIDDLQGAIIYYTNAAGDRSWSNILNWNTLANGNGDNPSELPWSEADGSTNDYILIDASDGNGVIVDIIISPDENVTGSCNIARVENHSTINSGTFTASLFKNKSIINGGIFSGNDFINESDGEINGGEFTAHGMVNLGAINFGELNVDRFTINNGNIQYENVVTNFAGTPYTGTWQYVIWEDGIYQYSLDLPVRLYFTNSTQDGLWKTLQNWNEKKDGSGIVPEAPPWSEGITAKMDLRLLDYSTTAPQINKQVLIGGNGEDFIITAECDPIIAAEIILNGYNILQHSA